MRKQPNTLMELKGNLSILNTKQLNNLKGGENSTNNLRVNHDSLADEILLVQSQSKDYILDHHDNLADEILLVQSQSKAYIPDRCRIQIIIKCQFVMVSMMDVHNHIIIVVNSSTTHTVRKITVGHNRFQ